MRRISSLHNRVDELPLQDKLGIQNLHENIKKLYEPLFGTVTNTSQDITKTITET